MQPLRQQRKGDNCCPIPFSKFATRPMRASSGRLANCSRISSRRRAKKGVLCHECDALSQTLTMAASHGNTGLFWSALYVQFDGLDAPSTLLPGNLFEVRLGRD